ncbi:MAG: pyridoxamine 5'-phosphate oxidase family protein [Spirochaetota bacterium]
MTEEKLRRADKRMNPDQAYKELTHGEYGVLGLVDEDGQPYTLPLNYCVEQQTIFFHAATEGRKLCCLAAEARVSFSVVTHHAVQSDKFTTYYRSVHVSGRARMIDRSAEKRRALILLAEKYSPGYETSAGEYIEKAVEHTAVCAIEIETLTGKLSPPE